MTHRDRRVGAARRLGSAVGVAALLCAMWLGWSRWSESQSALAAARTELAEVRRQAGLCASLRRERQFVAPRPRPQSDLIEGLRGLMQRHGVSPDTLSQVNLLAPQPIPNSAYQKQQAALVLKPIRPADLVRVLVEWTASEPQWCTRSIRLERTASAQPHGGGPGSGAAVAPDATPDDRFTASVVLENIQLASVAATSGSERPAAGRPVRRPLPETTP